METAIKERLKGQLVKGALRGWHSVGNGLLRGGSMIAEVFGSGQYGYSFQGVNHVVH